MGAGGEGVAVYRDIPGFCKSATLHDIRHHNYILTPGHYVGAAEIEDDGEPSEEKMVRLTAELKKNKWQKEPSSTSLSGSTWRTSAMAGEWTTFRLVSCNS